MPAPAKTTKVQDTYSGVSRIFLLGAALTSALVGACDDGGAPYSGSSTGGTAQSVAGSATSGSASGGADTGGTPNGGTTATGGTTPSGSSAGSGGSVASGTFNLLFRDDFDTLDSTRWQLMTHSWSGNLALFSVTPVKAEDGQLTISLLPAPEGTVDDTNAPKPYLGAEVRSFDTLTYGRVKARVKFAAGSAVVSSLVTIYTPWPADNWNELDVEILGAPPAKVQFNAMVYTGAPKTPPVTTSVTPTQDPFKPTLALDPTADFHVYTVEWTPSAATFSIDDQVVHTWTKNIHLMTLPQNVLLTVWASSEPSWAGPQNETTTQAKAVYDWVELYTYTP